MSRSRSPSPIKYLGGECCRKRCVSQMKIYSLSTTMLQKLSTKSHTKCNFPIDRIDSPVTNCWSQWNRMRYFLRIFPLCVEYWVIVKAVLRGIVCIGNGRTAAASESAGHASLCGATLLGSKSTLFLFLWQTLRQVPSSIISRHAKAVIVPWKQLSILLADVYLRERLLLLDGAAKMHRQR